MVFMRKIFYSASVVYYTSTKNKEMGLFGFSKTEAAM